MEAVWFLLASKVILQGEVGEEGSLVVQITRRCDLYLVQHCLHYIVIIVVIRYLLFMHEKIRSAKQKIYNNR